MISRKLVSLIVILFIFFGTVANIFAQARVDTVWGWYGPVECGQDTGHIALSDSHTQGEHSLNFAIHYVDNPDTLGFCFFFKEEDFGGILRPDLIRFDFRTDTIISNKEAWFEFVMCYHDTVWMSGVAGGFYVPEWESFLLNSFEFSNGYYWPSWEAGPAPLHIDSIGLDFRIYTRHETWPGDSLKNSASLLVDNLEFGSIDGSDTTWTLIDGMGDLIGVEEICIFPNSENIQLLNLPNPFGNRTDIQYQLPRSAYVDLNIYSVAGELVRVLLKRWQEPGLYTTSWNGKNRNGQRMPSGIYFCHLVIDESVPFTKKIILLR